MAEAVRTFSEAGTAADVAALITGRTDDDITAAVSAEGTDVVLRHVFAAMGESFIPERAGGHSARTQWEVQAPDGVRTYHVNVADGTCTVGEGPASEPRVTLAMSLPNYLRFIAGEFDGIKGLMQGKLRVTGDIMFGPVLESFFRA